MCGSWEAEGLGSHPSHPPGPKDWSIEPDLKSVARCALSRWSPAQNLTRVLLPVGQENSVLEEANERILQEAPGTWWQAVS